MTDETLTLLSEGLDLCARARQMDAMDRRSATLAISSNPTGWVESGQFDKYVQGHNLDSPHAPIETRSLTVPVWLQQQYDLDLADWEKRAKAHVAKALFFK